MHMIKTNTDIFLRHKYLCGFSLESLDHDLSSPQAKLSVGFTPPTYASLLWFNDSIMKWIHSLPQKQHSPC